MLRVWQKRLLDNRPSVTYEFATVGSHTQVLDAGRYDIWLVGAGGGGSLLRQTQTGTKHWARGGVGGVLHVRVNVPVQTTITVTVGSGGASHQGDFTSAGATVSGDNGGNTTITGLLNATLIAGAGTGSNIRSTSTTACNRTVGVQGINTASGSNIVAILENNVNTIVSTQGSSSVVQRRSDGQLNTNWAENTQKGLGGDIGWLTPTDFVNRAGGIGFVRIKTSD